MLLVSTYTWLGSNHFVVRGSGDIGIIEMYNLSDKIYPHPLPPNLHSTPRIGFSLLKISAFPTFKKVFENLQEFLELFLDIIIHKWQPLLVNAHDVIPKITMVHKRHDTSNLI